MKKTGFFFILILASCSKPLGLSSSFGTEKSVPLLGGPDSATPELEDEIINENVDIPPLLSSSSQATSLSSSSSSSSSSTSISTAESTLEENYQGRGEVYYNLSGTKGVVLCFHGHGGQAARWMKGDRFDLLNALLLAGYSFVCPTSLDRDVEKKWNSAPSADNVDVKNIDAILDSLGISASSSIFLIGHSQGTGMVTRYGAFGARKSHVVAAQMSNSIGGLVSNTFPSNVYRVPTLVNYAECDPRVSYTKIELGILMLTLEGVSVRSQKLDSKYSSGIEAGNYRDCHEFMNTETETIKWFQNPSNSAVGFSLDDLVEDSSGLPFLEQLNNTNSSELPF